MAGKIARPTMVFQIANPKIKTKPACFRPDCIAWISYDLTEVECHTLNKKHIFFFCPSR